MNDHNLLLLLAFLGVTISVGKFISRCEAARFATLTKYSRRPPEE